MFLQRIGFRCHTILATPHSQYRALNINATILQVDEFGEPHKVVKAHQQQINAPNDNEVLVKMLVAPINPADINMIQGKYGENPKLPFIPGNEGVATVLACGENVKEFAAGDRVIPYENAMGTWRTHALYPSQKLYKIPRNVEHIDAATITVNPSTAYRMLRDFVQLNKGDTIIQNGANSGVGQTVIQLCKLWGINSVNVIRNRPNVDELKATLKSLGATEVLTEEEIRTTNLFKSGSLPVPRLGFNCVGGKSATNIMRCLSNKGILVTYGAMSREALTMPNSALIFKDIAFRGYWMSRWSKEHSAEERHDMYSELFKYMACGQLKPPAHRYIGLNDYAEALAQLTDVKGMTGCKVLFNFNDE